MSEIEGGGESDEERAEAEKFNEMVSEGKLTPADMKVIEKSKTPEEVEAEKRIVEEIKKEVDEVLEKAKQNPNVLFSYFDNFDAWFPGGFREIRATDPERENQLGDYYRNGEQVTLSQYRHDLSNAIEECGLERERISQMHKERYEQKFTKEGRRVSREKIIEIINYIVPAYIKMRSYGYDRESLIH